MAAKACAGTAAIRVRMERRRGAGIGWEVRNGFKFLRITSESILSNKINEAWPGLAPICSWVWHLVPKTNRKIRATFRQQPGNSELTLPPPACALPAVRAWPDWCGAGNTATH